MNDINTYITEKLRIGKSIKSYDTINKDDWDMTLAIIKAVFISVYKNSTYKLKNLSTYVIQRSKLNWEDIIDILSEEYGYNFDLEDAKKFNGEFQSAVRPLLTSIERLINMKTIQNKNGQKIKGGDIYWGDWKDYRIKHNISNY